MDNATGSLHLEPIARKICEAAAYNQERIGVYEYKISNI